MGLDFFGSMVAAYRKGQLSQTDAQRFVTSFLEAKARSSRLRRGTGQCGMGRMQGQDTGTRAEVLNVGCWYWVLF